MAGADIASETESGSRHSPRHRHAAGRGDGPSGLCIARPWSRLRHTFGQSLSLQQRSTPPWPTGDRGRICTRRTTGRGVILYRPAAGCCKVCRSNPAVPSWPPRPRLCPKACGGERNWDYRYSWVRDASFTMQALWVAACPDEASDFFAFMTTAAASSIGPDIGSADHVRRRRRARSD